MNPKKFLSQLEHKEIVAAVKRAEGKTSGEIRVFISHQQPPDAMAAAKAEFAHLGMNRTSERNAVLIYVAPLAQKFAIFGDSGVHDRCGDGFWRTVADEMEGHFKTSRFTQGIVHGIDKAGDLLAQHFPSKPNQPNQLSDDVAHD
jgi:uncharacterized membrane protein